MTRFKLLINPLMFFFLSQSPAIRAASCGSVDAIFGVYSTTSIEFKSEVTINGNDIASGVTGSNFGLASDGSIVSGSVTFPGLDPSSFPTNSSTAKAEDTDSPIDGSSEVFYEEIKINNDKELTFNGHGPYHIKKLIIEDKGDVYLSAGTYFIDELIMGDNSHISLLNPPVHLQIGTKVDLQSKSVINEQGGDSPEDLKIFLHSNATFSGGAETKIKAIIVGIGNGKIEFEKKLKFEGIILSENDVVFGDDSELILSAANRTAINLQSTCELTDFDVQCASVFTSGIQIGGSTGTIEFESSGQVLGNPSSVLAAPSINKNHATSCGAGPCSASGLTKDKPIFPFFETTTSTTSIDINGSQTVGDSNNAYDKLKVKKDGILTFSTNQSKYVIKTLEIDDDATINFVAGDYFIADFKMDKNNLVVNVIGSGMVRIYSTKDLKFKKSALINSPSAGNAGTASKLFVFSSKNVKLESGATATGFFAARNDLELKGTSFLFGSVSGGKKVKIKESSALTYQANQLSGSDFGGSCGTTTIASSLDHFTVSHDNSGINCLAEAISASARDSNGDAIVDYVEAITLDTQSGKGTFSLSSGSGTFSDATLDDGLASYTFDDADDGVAQFSLSYKEGASSIDIDVFQSSDSSLRDDDTESNLVFSPSGFTFTQSVLSNPPPQPINDPVVTQIAGSNFTVHITAYGQTPEDDVCGVIEAYTGDQSVSFWLDYENPLSGTLVPTVNSNPIAANEGAASGQTVTFVSGQGSVVAKYKDVGRIQLHGKENAINGATNLFVVRPADMVIIGIENSLAVDNPAATSVTGDGFVAAGEAFTVTVEVRDAEGARTPNFGNETSGENIEIVASTLVIPAGGRNGSANDGAVLNGSNFSAVSPIGTFQGSSFSWDEFGIIRLQASIADDDYLGVGEISGTESGNVGRFYPASFDLASSSVLGACNNSTYMEEPALSINYDLQARGTSGNLLFNYDLGLLGVSGISTPAFHAENANDGTNLVSRLPGTTSTWNNGSYALTLPMGKFNRSANPDGPFETLVLGISVADGLDGIAISSPDMNSITSNDCVGAVACTAKSLSGTTAVRYGRLEVASSFGPETEPLDVPLRSRYFKNGGFVLNTLDDCTAYIKTGAGLSNYQGGLPALTVTAPSTTSLVLDGKSPTSAPLLLSAPGVANDGSVDVSYDAPAWLEYDWSGSGDEDPKGRASFGHFRGHDRVVYWREVF